MTDIESAPGELEESRRDAFRLSLLSKRKEAVQGRVGSGIEAEWQEDEEHYQGIDDANRAYANAHNHTQVKRWAAGVGYEAKKPQRSVIFLNITRPYVDAASARVADMLLPTDDRPWMIKPTPIPRLAAFQVAYMGGEEAIEQAREEAKIAAKGMQDEIDDCLNESSWHGEVRHVLEDAARLGSGVLKGPYPVKRTVRMYRKDESGTPVYTTLAEIKPGSRRIDPWNFFPDPACGESIHSGSYTFEREYVTARQLRDMLDMPGYDRAELVKALKEGPSHGGTRDAGDGSAVKAEDQFEMWIFYGECDHEDLAAVGVEHDGNEKKASAMAVMVNDRLVKTTLNVLDTGDFPYDVLAWQRRPGMPWGTGIARQIRTPQRMLNGAARSMMDNAGLSASPQLVFGNGVTPLDGNWTLTPGKQWRIEADADAQDVRAAFSAFVVPSVQAELQNVINFALKMAEDVTGMPAMLQGIRGDAPETLGGMQMQNNNASSVMRRLAKRIDDYLTAPHIQRFFDWMMQHSERDDIKGDFQIDVRASSALVERDAQQQFLLQAAQLARDPQFGINPAKLFAELAKGQRLDPKTVQYTPEEMAQRMQPQTNPVDEAKAGLIAAQTRKTDAEAVNKGVEGMYSATQAAQNIAVQPAVAPLADTLLKSAGFQDMDAAPIVPSLPGPVPAVPPQTNTNPMTPANPAVGMQDGIEGGEMDDSEGLGL